jgi:3-oxoacyl-[acyl-carrier-protein] synthase-1
MARHAPAEVVALGMVTPVGLCAAQTAASVRAGLGRFAESDFTDRQGEPVVMGRADGADLPALAAALEERELSPRHERMIRLGGTALAEAIGSALAEAGGGRAGHRPPPLCLGLPEARPEVSYPVGAELLEMLALQAGCALQLKGSRVFPAGRSAGLVALDHALTILDRREASSVVVGAVDSYWDAGLLDALDAEGRLKTSKVSDGFIPGEGAAFVVLAPITSKSGSGKAQIAAIGQGHEPGHLYSDAPYHGEGLAGAIRAVFETAPPAVSARRTASVYASLNGESHWAKEWGVSHIRSAERFAEPLRLEHPADCMGDPGAALGLIMLGLATISLRRARAEASALIWCSSDRGQRAAALVTTERLDAEGLN